MREAVVRLTIAGVRWRARINDRGAPHASSCLRRLLPYRGELIHARWSGDACWAPLASAWPAGEILAPECPVSAPPPGEILLYAGDESEPELLLPYGASRFASRAGPMRGSAVLHVIDPGGEWTRMGLDVLWRGARPISIELEVAMTFAEDAVS